MVVQWRPDSDWKVVEGVGVEGGDVLLKVLAAGEVWAEIDSGPGATVRVCDTEIGQLVMLARVALALGNPKVADGLWSLVDAIETHGAVCLQVAGLPEGAD